MPRAVRLTAVLLLACGCDRPPAPPSQDESSRAALAEVGEMLKDYARDHGRPPAAALDVLRRYEPAYPAGSAAVSNGDCVVFWGAGLAPGGADVLAYEKDAAAAGGWVLLRDGTVKRLTAAEFRAAPKAGR